ncbi:MAG: anthranilate synthase component I [Chloroflexi bacterium]|nr:anthranilate synthase component I [Chloroflexota bacterium]
MYYPSLEQVRTLAGQGNIVPVYRELLADLETPVSAFLKIATGDYSFLLESVEGGERLARYSFLGTEPYRVIQTGPNTAAGRVEPLALVEADLAKYRLVPVPGLPRFHGGAVGYLSYEAARYFEELPSPEANPLSMPEAVFLLTDTLLVFDHLQHKIKVVSHVRLEGNIEWAYAQAVERIDRLVERLSRPLAAPELGPALSLSKGPPSSPPGSNLTPEQFQANVARAKDYIYAGDIIQVVLSQRLARPTQAAPFTIYRALRSINPSPYMYYLHLGQSHIIGASPEMLVRVEDGVVTTHPIAGTRPRSAEPAQDAALAEELAADEKERAEHIMLVDLGRNDIGRVSLPGTVRVPELMTVERYSHVMHLVSHVEGKLRPELSAADALRACFPAGTVSGAPKIRAMEIISELEPDKRGAYAGAVGYFAFSGNMDTAITIRTIVLVDGVAYVQAGAGIVADSVPEREHQECLNKAMALLKAIDQAERPG